MKSFTRASGKMACLLEIHASQTAAMREIRLLCVKFSRINSIPQGLPDNSLAFQGFKTFNIQHSTSNAQGMRDVDDPWILGVEC